METYSKREKLKTQLLVVMNGRSLDVKRSSKKRGESLLKRRRDLPALEFDDHDDGTNGGDDDDEGPDELAYACPDIRFLHERCQCVYVLKNP